ncbi:MAG: V-type ATP synthase subunit C [Lachnospiraceae bacterium]|nr:V-type ATP synthase subunit C [Lachnospiraceae bacterium]MCR5083163.1 V-type ATPase subunit [Parasporobacterium sp.]
MGELYAYAVARIRSKELGLLNKQALDQLLSSKTYEDCLRFLSEKGWGDSENATAEEMLAGERDKTWEIVNELVKDQKDKETFNVFLYANDFHNLKAAIKEAYTGKQVPNIFIETGTTVGVDVIKECVKNNDFLALPDYMRKCAEEAYEVQFQTGDSQLCDIIIDKATLEAIYQKGKESKNDLISGYAELKCAAANINIAIRSCKTKKGKEFLERAFAKIDTLNVDRLVESALNSEDAIYDYLETTTYADAIDAIKESSSAFEKWCDDKIMNYIKPQKYKAFSYSPIAAYVLAKENEIKSVRIILSGKLNDLPEEEVKERLREMYV